MTDETAKQQRTNSSIMRQTNDAKNGDEEERIRERLKAKIDSRRDSMKNGTNNSTNSSNAPEVVKKTEAAAATGSTTKNGVSFSASNNTSENKGVKAESKDEKSKKDTDSTPAPRRERRGRGGKRNRRGNNHPNNQHLAPHGNGYPPHRIGRDDREVGLANGPPGRRGSGNRHPSPPFAGPNRGGGGGGNGPWGAQGPGYRHPPPGRGGGGGGPPPYNGRDVRDFPPHFRGGGGGPPFNDGYDWRGAGGRGPNRRPSDGRFGDSDNFVDDFGRRLPPATWGSRSRSRSRDGGRRGGNDGRVADGDRRRRGRSFSRSRSRSPVGRHGRSRRRRSNSRSRSASMSSRSSGSISSSGSSRSRSRTSRSSSGSSRSSQSVSEDDTHSTKDSKNAAAALQNDHTKDQRTIFVSQLVSRTTEKDIARFFRSQGLKTNEIILLRDKRTGLHKGSAYVELRRMDDVSKSVLLSGKPPDFQRFPILIKASEAEKNYSLSLKTDGTGSASNPTIVATTVLAQNPVGHPPAIAPPLVGTNGKLILAQKLYVGNLDTSVSQEHLFALFNPFGQLEQVNLQKTESGVSKGFAFLQFRDPKEAFLALQTMSGRMLFDKPIKTGWASHVSTNPNVDVVTTQEFPEDSTNRAQTAYMVLAQLTTQSMTRLAAAGAVNCMPLVLTGSGTSRVPTVAEARASLAAQSVSRAAAAASVVAVPPLFPTVVASTITTTLAAEDPTKIGNADCPTKNVLVHNMFNKDEESDEGWEVDIREEFQEECKRYGTILKVKVMHTEPGGKIYATFDSIAGAQNCASSLAGRWFDKRQLRVEFVPDATVPN